MLRSNKMFAAFSSRKTFIINEVIHLWSGAITSNTAKVNAKLTTDSSAVRLVASTSPALTSPVYGSFTNANFGNNRMAAMNISSLAPNTKYYYAVEADSEVDTSADAVGSFTTPPNTAFSFKFSTASCSLNSNHPVFTRIGEKNPFLHITTGDLHYADPNSATDINVHRIPYENTLVQAALKNLLLNTPIAYTWDDHDFSGDNSDASAAGKTNARLAYQEYVPHYPLPAGTGNVPIYQAFTIGRIRFIISDLRSERTAISMMGSVQKDWFKNECVQAKTNNLVIAWISSVSYGGDRADNWGGYAAERTELANFFRDNLIQNMFIICGDAHMIAIDNGNNHDFSTGANNPYKYPIFQAAALNQTGSNKGGTFSQGTFENPDITNGQYGLIQVTDAGGNQININFTGYRVTNAGVETTLTTYDFISTIFIIVPIKFLSFSVKSADDHLKSILTWKTEEEQECKEYIIEKSSNGIDFNVLQKIPCLGNSNGSEYTAYDNNPSEKNFYRIKAIEKNGKFSYSKIESLHFDTQTSVVIYSGLANDLDVTINTKKTGAAVYLIYNSLSMQLIKKEIVLLKGKNQLHINGSGFSSGMYFFKLIIENTHEITKKFVIR
jgi:alkaline phosphatase D